MIIDMKILTTIAVVLISVLLPASTCDARIGWTLEQCRERYGKEVGIDKPPASSLLDTVQFRVGNFFIGASFLYHGI